MSDVTEPDTPLLSPAAADPDMRDLVVEFVATLGERVDAIEAAISAGDVPRARVLVHQLTGVAGSYFVEIDRALRDVDAQLKGGTPQALREHLRELRALSRRARATPPDQG